MAKEEFYKQCVLRQETKDGSISQTTSWIPEEGAEIGKTMKLKNPMTKVWKEGRWEVVSVGEKRLSGKSVRERIRIGRKYMATTDD